MHRFQSLLCALLIALTSTLPSWYSPCFGSDDNEKLPLCEPEQEQEENTSADKSEGGDEFEVLTIEFLSHACGLRAQFVSLERARPSVIHHLARDHCRAPPRLLAI